jgi:hypothetical protein
MTDNLGAIFELLKDAPDLCDRYLFEELIELIDDEEVEVRNKAIHNFKHMGKFTPEVFKEWGMPFFRTLIEKWDEHTEYLMTNLTPILDEVKVTLFPENMTTDVLEMQEFLASVITEYSMLPINDIEEEVPK